ncbi:MAG: DUF3592 domain-containing protein [Chitinophagaceae bacterium]|nr:DUF3592 domain-containing protein [Chitinophagaceae bacterium]
MNNTSTEKPLFKSKAAYISTLIFIFSMGAFIASIIIFSLYKEKKFKLNAQETNGIITHIGKKRFYVSGGSRSFVSFVGTITYQDLDGKEFTCQTTPYKNSSKYNIGEEVKVYYDKINSSKLILAEKYVFAKIATEISALILILLPIFHFRYKKASIFI